MLRTMRSQRFTQWLPWEHTERQFVHARTSRLIDKQIVMLQRVDNIRRAKGQTGESLHD